MAVDILPSSIPLDASVHFSNVLLDYLKVIVREYRREGAKTGEEKEMREALERATVARDGMLVGKHRWLSEPVAKWRAEAATQAAEQLKPKKKVLMLGSGMVAGPAVDEIAKRSDVELLVG
jgi:alpha-aminoadipic semialdehyde synthase